MPKGRPKGSKYIPDFDKQNYPPIFHGDKNDVLKDIDLEQSPHYAKWHADKADVEWKILHGNEIYQDIIILKSTDSRDKRRKKTPTIVFHTVEEINNYILKNQDLFNPRWLPRELRINKTNKKGSKRVNVRRGWRNKRKVAVKETGEIFETPRDCWIIYPYVKAVHVSLKTGEPYNGLHFIYVD